MFSVQLFFVEKYRCQPHHGKQYGGDGKQAVNENGGRLSRKQSQQNRIGQTNYTKHQIGWEPDEAWLNQHIFRLPFVYPLGIIKPADEVYEEKQSHDGIYNQGFPRYDKHDGNNQQPQNQSDQHIQAKQTQTESPDFFQIIISFLLSGNVCIVSDPYLVNSFSFHCTKGWLPFGHMNNKL